MKRTIKTWLARGAVAVILLALAALLFWAGRRIYYYYNPDQMPVTSEMCVVAVWADSGTLLAVGTGEHGDLCVLPAETCTLRDETGSRIGLADFSAGDLVLVSGKNEILYSWPASWPSAHKIVKTGGADPTLAADALTEYTYIANAAAQ